MQMNQKKCVEFSINFRSQKRFLPPTHAPRWGYIHRRQHNNTGSSSMAGPARTQTKQRETGSILCWVVDSLQVDYSSWSAQKIGVISLRGPVYLEASAVSYNRASYQRGNEFLIINRKKRFSYHPLLLPPHHLYLDNIQLSLDHVNPPLFCCCCFHFSKNSLNILGTRLCSR